MMSNKYNTVASQRKENILIITLNRPEKRNALNSLLISELYEILRDARENKQIHGIILTGAGKAFCAGADLAYLETLLSKKYDEHLKDSKQLMEMYYELYTYSKPTLALVNGPALAGGCGLVTVCDFAFATTEAKFGYPEVKIGFVAALVSIFLVQAVGYRRAKELLLTGNLIDATKAKELGLINDIVSPAQLMPFGLSFISDLLKNSLVSIQLSKKLLNLTVAKDVRTRLEEASKFNAQIRQENDFKEGILAFLQKRPPKWMHLK